MHQSSSSKPGFSWAVLVAISILSVGCTGKREDAVVLYSAADREYAAPLVAAFGRREEGLEIAAQYDVESTKTLGLVTRIESEASRPRCDVFWNNEIMHTLRLDKAGLLASVSWDIPRDWPAAMKGRNWVGFAARARVLLINTKLLPDREQWPASVMDLADPKWKGKCCIANPVYGTTATHFTVLREKLGKAKATEFFKNVSENAVTVAGNKQVAQGVSSGQFVFGLTDTDDSLIEIDSGLPVEMVFPDQQPAQLGTLRIPNTVAVIKNSPHPVAAARLANHLISEDTEGRLAMGPSGQFPIRPGHEQKSRAQGDAAIRWMDVDFAAVADLWEESLGELKSLYN